MRYSGAAKHRPTATVLQPVSQTPRLPRPRRPLRCRRGGESRCPWSGKSTYRDPGLRLGERRRGERQSGLQPAGPPCLLQWCYCQCGGSRGGLSLRKRRMACGDHTGHQLALYPSLGQCGTYRSSKHVSPLRQWLGLTAPQARGLHTGTKRFRRLLSAGP